LQYRREAAYHTGRGMDAATLARIFDPFFTTKEPGRGTGLGLATVFAIASKLQGKVQVESAPGKGSVFELFLPRSALPLSPVLRPISRSIALRGRRETILLVEDDDALRRAARTALEQGGYSVVEASDGDEALQVAEVTSIKAVVTDVVLPGKSGPRVVAALRARFGAELRVLYVSGYVAQGESLDLSAPGTGYLVKPYAAADLVEEVHRLLGAVVVEPGAPAAAVVVE
jgi:CheY-like chemotaxis protein